MVEILTVCTGNVCRSPLAELLLRSRLRPLEAVIVSAGTRGLRDAPMTPESLRLAANLGIESDDAQRHRSRFLLEPMLSSPDLILTMARDHRREVVELAPARMRATFTLREFARLAEELSDSDLRRAADVGGSDAAARLREVCAAVAAQRGVRPPPSVPTDDDVVDPYGRSWATYELSAAQLTPAIDRVVRALRIALSVD